MADREASDYLRLLAEIMGVEASDDSQATREAIEKELGVHKPSGVEKQLADALGMSSTGYHPGGRESTIEELVLRYRAGELKDTYDLPKPGVKPSVLWFDQSDKDGYETDDGFHPQADSYEFTKLWYQLVGEAMDLTNCGDWHVAHGGLRWEFNGDPAGADHGAVEAALASSYDRYCEVFQALEDGLYETAEAVEEPGETTPPAEEAWHSEDWDSLLND